MEQPHKKQIISQQNKVSSAELKYRRKQYDRHCLILLRMIIVSLVDYLKEYWTQSTQRMRETTRVRFPIGFLIFSYPWFSHTYPHSNRICPSTRIRYISGLFLLQGLLWEYWKLSMRRGGHLEYNIHGTTDLCIFEFSVHTIPDSQNIQKFPLWRADSCGRKSNPEICVEESTVQCQYFF